MTIKRPKQNLKRLFIPVIILLLITCGMIQYAVVYNEQEVAGVSNPSEVMLDITRDYEDILSEDNDIIEEKPDNLFLQRLTRYDDPVKAPYIEFKNILDKNMSLNDFKGQWIVLNFWATWCAPCLDEIPDLNRLQREYADDLVILSVSDEDRQLLVDFEQQLPLETHSKRVAMGVELPPPFAGAFVIRPSSFIIDREGVVRRYLLGNRNYSFFKKAVVPLI